MPAAVTAPNPSPYTLRKKGRYNPKGVYGPIDYMRMGQSLIKKYPTEVTAIKHWRSPDDPEFLPLPERPARHNIHCYECGEHKDPEKFPKDALNTWRFQRHKVCRECHQKRYDNLKKTRR